jgi:RND family efflux transporter MFP subunit
MTDAASNPQLFKGILDYMRDGVIAVDRQGRIVAFNPAAGRILAIDSERALGQTLLELFLHDEGADEFTHAIFEAIYEASVIQQKRVRYQVGGIERFLSVTTSQMLLGDTSEAAGIVCVFSDVTEVERLRVAEAQLTEEIKGRHNELQNAYLDLETATKQMEAMGKRSSRIRIMATGGVIALFVVIGGLSWWRSAAAVPRPPTFAAGGQTGGGSTITAMPHPIESRITVPGAIYPGSIINVVAPFDGPIKEKRFDYGQQVERGATLLVMDTADIEMRVRDARAELIKAQGQEATLKNWTQSSEVVTARANALASDQALQELKRRAASTKALLDQGIIAQTEYDGMVDQMRGAVLQNQSTHRDLQNALNRGNDEAIRVAELQFQNVQAKDKDLEDQIAHAVVTAPVAGVILRPPDDSSGGAQASHSLEVGAHVAKGQAVIGIGNLEQLAVSASVDEIDVNKVAVGQTVQISNDAFTGPTISGHLTAVSTQADSGQNGNRALPTFAIKAVIDQITPEQRQRIRIGMTANLSVLLYSNPQAIVVPVDAVIEDQNGTNVRVKKPTGEIASVPVQVGITTLEGVEIRSGLNPGDQIVVGSVPNS